MAVSCLVFARTRGKNGTGRGSIPARLRRRIPNFGIAARPAAVFCVNMKSAFRKSIFPCDLQEAFSRKKRKFVNPRFLSLGILIAHFFSPLFSSALLPQRENQASDERMEEETR